MEKSDFVYIMYPVKVEMLEGPSLPFIETEKKQIPMIDEEDFVPLWYGNARFPEDDI